MFFNWAVRAKKIEKPDFPEDFNNYTMSLRKLLTKERQAEVLDQVFEMYKDTNPKVYVGIKWLCTYTNLRPDELRNIKEGDIDLDRGVIQIPHPKERKPKFVYLIPEDVELICRLRQEVFPHPELYFFRHASGKGGVKVNSQFGKNYLYTSWKKACEALGIYDVDLYGGTRHSSTVAMRENHSVEDVRRATMHGTNKAFERYLQFTGGEVRPLYSEARPKSKADNKLTTLFREHVAL
jgi:integrase